VLGQLLRDTWYLKVTSSLHNGRNLEPKFKEFVLEVDELFQFQGRMYIHEEGDIEALS
jgi:hypothetical protein